MTKINIYLQIYISLFLCTNLAVSSDSLIDEFGIFIGKPINNNSIVIINDTYIDPPYVVSRKGLEVFINNNKVPNPVRHSGEKPLFDYTQPNNLSKQRQQRLFGLLKVATKIYETNIERGTFCIFDSNGYKKFDIYTAIYHTPTAIDNICQNQLGLKLRMDSLFVSLLRIDEFGTKDGDPVDDGYIFIDGEYIESPYVVSRIGLGLFINTEMVHSPTRIPVQNTTAQDTSYKDPNIPFTITKDSSSFDPDIIEYLGHKRAYLLRDYSKEQVTQLMVQVYNDLPCVESARMDPDDSGVVVVVWSDGTHDRIRQFPPLGRRQLKMDSQSILNRIEYERANFENCLQKGDYYFLFSQAGHITGNKTSAEMILPKLIPILQASSPIEEKLLNAKKLDLGNLGEPIIRAMGEKRLNSSVQLQKRLNDYSKTK